MIKNVTFVKYHFTLGTQKIILISNRLNAMTFLKDREEAKVAIWLEKASPDFFYFIDVKYNH